MKWPVMWLMRLAGNAREKNKKKDDGVADKTGRLNWGLLALLLPARGQVLHGARITA